VNTLAGPVCVGLIALLGCGEVLSLDEDNRQRSEADASTPPDAAGADAGLDSSVEAGIDAAARPDAAGGWDCREGVLQSFADEPACQTGRALCVSMPAPQSGQPCPRPNSTQVFCTPCEVHAGGAISFVFLETSCFCPR
jgi:hypothetical protein